MNLEPIPFIAQALGKPTTSGDHELAGVGMQIYNRWLADFVSQAPHRHIGLAYLPMWDVDAAVAEVEWAHEAGLRGVNFPAMRDGALPEYNRKLWEPLWSVCEDLGMPLVTHVGAGTNARYSGLEGVALLQIESGGFTSRRAVWWLIFAGVFERHPGPQAGDHRDARQLVPRPPPTSSTPCGRSTTPSGTNRSTRRCSSRCPAGPASTWPSNVFYGASFASPYEVAAGRRARQRHPAPLGLGLPPPRGHLREPRGPRRDRR